jgi:AAA+ ATPase superfamily predicted ATPase
MMESHQQNGNYGNYGNGNGNNHHRFSLQDICKGSNTVICGKRMVGKSHLMVDILKSRKARNVMFASRYAGPFYRKYLAQEDVHEKYSPQILKSLIAKQEKNSQEELVICFDDIAVNKDIWNDHYIQEVIRYGSSLGITIIFSIQYAGQLTEMFQRNIDYVFCFRDNIIDNQKLLYTEFGGMFSTFEEFKTVHDNCIAEPYRCLVFDLKNPKKDPIQSVFWYKSPDTLVKVPAKVKDPSGSSISWRTWIEKKLFAIDMT